MALSEAPLPFKLHLHLHLTLPRKVCDLSGRIPFQVIAEISRTRHGDLQKHETPVSVLAEGSLLDIPSALQNGLLRIVPMMSLHKVEEGAKATEILPSPEISTAASQKIVDLGKGSKLRKRTPHSVLFTLDVSRMRGMEDGRFYIFELGSRESQDIDQPHLRWWLFHPEPAQQPNLTSPGKNSSPKLSCSLGMSRFKAVAQLAIPPRFDYQISVRPSTISLSNPTDFTVSIEATLKETSTYTIYSQRMMEQPHTMYFMTASIFSASI
jgi:hypothetical protein